MSALALREDFSIRPAKLQMWPLDRAGPQLHDHSKMTHCKQSSAAFALLVEGVRQSQDEAIF
jgi:hypothetical protein